MDAKQALLWMETFNKKIQENKDYLSELDSPIGDGDHGGNMARGMAAVMQELSEKDYETADQVFKVPCNFSARLAVLPVLSTALPLWVLLKPVKLALIWQIRFKQVWR